MFREESSISVRRDRVALIGTLAALGTLSAWLLPDGWRLASLPLALICGTIAQRYVAGRTAQSHTGDDVIPVVALGSAPNDLEVSRS